MRLFLLTALCWLCAQCVVGQDLPRQPNLAANPGFEELDDNGRPLAWSAPAPVYSLDAEGAHTGDACLKFVNPDPGNYVLCGQQIALEPGRLYEFSVWVKTEGIEGDDSGATICLEWYDADGEYLGGSYPAGVKGDHDWTQIHGSGRVQERAARGSVVCYVRKGMAGTAWWDDVEVRRTAASLLSAALVEPGYRGRFAAMAAAQARVRVALNLADYDLALEDVAVTAHLVNPGGPMVGVPPFQPTASEFDVTVDLPPMMQLGEYPLAVRVTRRANDRELAQQELRLTCVPADAQYVVYIDEHRRVIVNGEPFFPLGMYWSGVNEADLDLYADSPFNCLMPYGSPSEEAMDWCHERGLKVIYSIKDYYAGSAYCPQHIKTPEDEEPAVRAKVEEMRDHPALLAWYLNDELPTTYMDRLNAHQEWVSALDPNHPTWVVLYQYGQVRQYINSFDVIGTDPYPIPAHSPSRAAQYTRVTREQVFGARPTWQVPQVFNWACYRKTEEEKQGLRPPTLEEMRSMAWQCICEGATGLVFYSFFDLKRDELVPFEEQWELVKQMAAEIRDMFPILLSVEPTPEITVDAPEWLHWTARAHEGKLYIIAVNDGDGEGEVKFTLPAALREVGVRGEDRKATIQGDSFTDTFARLGVRAYEIDM